jgi:hypothetical protein
VGALPAAGGRVAVGDVFGQVLGDVTRVPVRLRCAGDDTAGVQLGAEPDHVPRLGVGVGIQGIERLLPGEQRNGGVGVDVPAGLPIPDWRMVGGVAQLGGGWPPDLVVGGGGDLP